MNGGQIIQGPSKETFVGNRHVARNAKREGKNPNEDGTKILFFLFFQVFI